MLEQKQQKHLLKHFETMDKLTEATKEELMAINEIGAKMADSIVAYFEQEEVQELIRGIKSSMV